MKRAYLEFNAAGVTFGDCQKSLRQHYESNNAFDVCLLDEPTNTYDSNAIAIRISHNGLYAMAGYIPARYTRYFHKDGAIITGHEITKHPEKEIYCLKLRAEYNKKETRVPEEII